MTSGKKFADDVHAALLSSIVEGRYRPGDVLNEIPISAEFGMSRTPVREALQRLVAEGLVERGPRRALLVRKVPIQSLHELFEAMGEFEALATYFAALRMSELERQALMAIVEAGEGTTAEAFEEVNGRFHKAIRDGAHNATIAEVISDLETRSMPWRHVQFRRGGRVETSQNEHRAIAAAIIARDGAEAQRLMRAHTAITFGVVLEIFAQDEQGAR